MLRTQKQSGNGGEFLIGTGWASVKLKLLVPLARLYHIGFEAVPIRYVLIRDVQGKFKTQAPLSTDLAAEPQQILE